MHKEARLSDELFSREEIQGGGLSRPRRARSLLYLIEQEAQRVKDRRAAMVTAAPEAGVMLSDTNTESFAIGARVYATVPQYATPVPGLG